MALPDEGRLADEAVPALALLAADPALPSDRAAAAVRAGGHAPEAETDDQAARPPVLPDAAVNRVAAGPPLQQADLMAADAGAFETSAKGLSLSPALAEGQATAGQASAGQAVERRAQASRTDPEPAVVDAPAVSVTAQASPAPGEQTPASAGAAVEQRPLAPAPAPQQAVAARLPAAKERVDQTGSGSGADDIDSLLRFVQQAERKPLPEGILKALEVQQRLAAAAPGDAVLAPAAAGGPGLPVASPQTAAGSALNLSAGLPPPGAAAVAATGNGGPATGGLAGTAALTDSLEAAADSVAEGGDAPDEALNRPALAQTVTSVARGAPPGAGFSLPQGLAPGTPAWGQTVGERLLMLSAGGVQMAEIQLDPPELGSLQVRLLVQHDQVSLSISSPHAQVRDALEQQMPRLREMLAEQGLNLDSSTVADDSGRRGRQADGEPERIFTSSVGAGDAGEVVEAAAPAVTAVRRSLVDQYV
ncbi:flagellar hook-length control protein FliK [Marinobacterium nitratireducens]|nr:flagellar hook-length control protein FliK [Marinobacterium nitratireducens]